MLTIRTFCKYRSVAVVIAILFYWLVLSGPVLAGPVDEGLQAYNRSDFAVARQLWQPLAEQGDASAQFWLGELYYQGEGVAVGYFAALKWLQAAAKQGSILAWCRLGTMYEEGDGVTKDMDNARQLYRQAAPAIKSAAERGDSWAQFWFGAMSLAGYGIDNDDTAAVNWFRKAAEQGSSRAQNKLGMMHLNGLGVPVNDKEAYNWFLKAAEQGNIDAMNYLGWMCEVGLGTVTNDAEAAKWYKNAAEQGNAKAQYKLGLLYANGHGVPKDVVESLKLYRMAAEQGHREAQNLVGCMFARGIGTQQDDVEAVKWLRMAAIQGHTDAQISLAVMYDEGRGVSKDEAEALKWYHKAAIKKRVTTEHTAPLSSASPEMSNMPRLQPQVGLKSYSHAAGMTNDGKNIISWSWDGVFKTWDIASGRELKSSTVKIENFNLGAAMTPDMKYGVSGSSAGAVDVWDLTTGNYVNRLLGHKRDVFTVAISNDGKMTASVSYGSNVIALWDSGDSSLRLVLQGHTAKVINICFSSDGKKLFSISDDKTIKVWDTETGKEIRTLPGIDTPGGAIAVNKDGRIVVSEGERFSTVAINVETGKVLWQKYEHTSYPIRAAISPDGRLAATGSEGQVFVWSLENKGEQVCRLNTIKYEVNHLVFPNNNTLLVSGADGKNRFSIRLWDVVKCSELQVFRGGTDTTTRVAIAHDARTALSGKISGAVEHWDMTTGKTLQRLNGNQSGIFAIALTSDEKVVAAGDSDGRVVVWNLATGEKLQDKQLHRKKMTVFSMAFLGKQKLLSGSQDKKYVFWDYGSDNIESHSFVDSDSIFDIVTVVGVSDDHRLALAGGHGGELQLLNINDTGVKINKVSEENQTDAAAFVPGGKMFALAGPGPTIRLRDSVTTGLVKTFSGHTEPIRKISFSPDGKLLATASADQTVMLWDVASGAELGICRGHREAVVDVAFTKDSRYLLTSADWGEPEIIWDVPKCSLLVKRYSFFDGSWVMIDPEGRFDTNNLEELKGLHWIMPDDPQRPLPLEIFMRNYYTPKLYLKRINNTKFKDIQSLASLNRTQPKVEIIGIEREPGIDNLVTVKVKVTSLKSQVQKIDNNFLESGVYDLRLFRDGQMVWGWSTEPTNPDMTLERWREHYRIIDTGEMVITIPHIRLPQRQGVTQSTFTVYTYNNDQVKSETSPPFPWKIAPVAKPQPRYAYLITMATNANQSGWDLTLAVASAKLATDLWLNKLQPNYEVVPIVLESKTDANGVILPNVTATKAHLRTVLDVLAGREKSVPHDLRAAVDPTGKLRIATPDDAVIVYIASHGYVTPQGQFYVIPYDTGTQRGITEKLLTQCQQQPAGKSCAVAKNFLDHAISSEELSFWWHGVDAGELVLVLDTCFSAAVPGQDFRPGPLGDPGFGQLSYDKGMRILAATQPDKTARALARLGHTLLVEALKTASQGRQDQSIAEWFRATEHVLPQKVQLLYPELKENDLQLPELMDFASKKTIPKLTAQ